MDKFLILMDKRKYVAESLAEGAEQRIDVALLKTHLMDMGAIVEVQNVHTFDCSLNYRGWYIIYPSSEDKGLFYKEYIEDILLRLNLGGAILLPSFELFRAHHNKVFMESYRTLLSDEYNTIKSFSFFGIDDLENKLNKNIQYPIVLKTSQGAGSSGVSIAYNRKEAIRKAKRMSKITYYDYNESRKKCVRHILGKVKRTILRKKILEKATGKEKMICQNYVPNLKCDYKVLVFGEKYFLLRRENRKSDFRASGSGLLSFPENLSSSEEKVLDYARGAYKQLNVPMLSIDIAYDGKKCHMIEFQCVDFGPYTLQFSEWYYSFNNKKWLRTMAKSILEKEMADSYIRYVRQKNF